MKRKILISAVILIMLLLNLFLASGILTKDVMAVDGDTTITESRAGSSYKGSPGTIYEGPNPGSYAYKLCGDFECFTTSGAPYYIPQNGSYQIYCIAHGTPADAYYYDITKAQAESCIGLEFNAHGSHAVGRYEGLSSTTFYTVSGGGSLEPWQAYVVSDEPVGSYTDYKQEALWQYSNGLYQEAMNYQDFDNKVRPKNGLDPTDVSDSAGLKLKVNQNTGEYTYGPYTMNYTEGTYGGITFGGISDMKVIGYNKDGAIVRDDIEVKRIVIDNQGKTPEYFEPEGPLYVDETEQVYPKDGEEFEVVFDDPNAGLADDDPNRVVSFVVKVEFQYMLANGEKVTLQRMEI